MSEEANDMVRRLHREQIERIRGATGVAPRETFLPPEMDLPEGSPDDPLYAEWSAYRKAVVRLLGEGQRGKFALVKDGHAITVWDTLRDAVQAGRLLHGEQ